MTGENTILVKFMNWMKKNRYYNGHETPSMIVHKYLSNPEEESTLPQECFHIDGEGDVNDDFGTGVNVSLSEKRYCKGCYADVTNSMYCSCGDFPLQKSDTLSEAELKTKL